MNKRTARLVGWSVVALAVILRMATLVIMVWAHRSLFDDTIPMALWFIPSFALAVVGALIVSRQPENLVGWLACSIVAESIGSFADTYAQAGFVYAPGALPAAGAMAWIGSWLGPPTPTLMLPFLLMLFPNGRPPSPRWRPIVAILVGWVVVLLLAMAFGPTAVAQAGPTGVLPYPNPVAIHGLIGNILVVIEEGGWLLSPLVGLLTIAAVILRFRRARGRERQQLKWFVYAAGIVVGDVLLVFLLGLIVPESADSTLLNTTLLIAITAVPVAVGIAIVSYRLYDIDLLINRTLIYTILTLALALIYLGSVVVLEQIFRVLTGQATDLAIVASTLTSAALFQPLRRRIQTTIDRRFYRHKYDATRVLASFGTLVRDEVELDSLADHLVAVVGETMQPAEVSLWLRPWTDKLQSSTRPIKNGGD